MQSRFNLAAVLRLVGSLTTMISAFIGPEAHAHEFNQQVDASDSEYRGNNNYASWYAWNGTQSNYETSSGERHSYALQIFEQGTRILGNTRPLLQVTASADAWYHPSGRNSMQTTSVTINSVELLRCIDASGCGDVRSVPATDFYWQTRMINFGTLIGWATLVSAVMGDISLDVAARSSATSYLGRATGLLARSSVTLVAGVNTLSRQFLDDQSDDYRLLNLQINADEGAEQGTSLNTSGITTGTLVWRNREGVDVAQMDGPITVGKRSQIGWKVVTLVNEPAYFWAGQRADNVGSTQTF